MLFQFRNNRGQAMLEFALVLPILLLLVFGIIDFGIIFFDNLVITQAAREGARVGVVGGSDVEILDIYYFYITVLPPSRALYIYNGSRC
jgi:Flp pilus assembly protein TadG